MARDTNATFAVLPQVPATTSPEKILKAVRECGGVIIKSFLSREQAEALDEDIVREIANIKAGSSEVTQAAKDFHGQQTKRLTNLVTHSQLFRDQILDKDLVYDILDQGFKDDNKAYWMSTAQAIEIGPGNKAQPLHRDLGQYRVFQMAGRDGPESMFNFLIATTKCTDLNGATRVIPGSHADADFGEVGRQEDTIPAELEPGDCLFIGGKVVHGGGANRTADELRRVVSFSFCAAYITPEEAFPFTVSMDTAKTMSKRAQRSIGFRSGYPKGAAGLWQHNFRELAEYLGLDV
ncbi:Dioxygenase [Pseudocercospora fuligena]|uniref:Dioxygenase n=1 Tax=Pseudocercospora fuligena TaxID=685502 RepID=A0A8H6RJW0_9PEZI|nr:Dioxygenase [Pseudocercospora fuligena]